MADTSYVAIHYVTGRERRNGGSTSGPDASVHVPCDM